MKIVVLDGYTVNPGDLSWSAFESLGELTVYDRTAPELVLERAAGAEAVLTNKTVLSAATLAALPDLRYIGVLATGMNVIDLDAAKDRGVAVTNVPAYGSSSVAQMVFALLLELTNQTSLHNQAVHDGAWVASEDFSFTRAPLIELDGLTLGVVGLGAIGQVVARMGLAFGMTVMGNSQTPKNLPGITDADLDTIFTKADVITLHCPLTPETEQLINADRLKQMKSNAFLINTGRGPLVDEVVLARALNEGDIAGAGLDVLSVEPPNPDNPLLNAKNCVITPHIAWATRAARARLLNIAAEHLATFANV